MFHKLHEDFEDVNLIYIPQNKNGRADALAKEAKTKYYIFPYIDQTRTDRDVL